MDSRHLSKTQRLGVYTYLACFLPVGRNTLMKRIKVLTLKEEGESKLRTLLDKLKQAVEQAMPTLLEKYYIDSAAAAQARFESREADAAVTDNMKEDPPALSDDDDRLTDLPQLNENGSDKKVKSVTVRKKFPWTDQLRVLLCAVVQLKMDSYHTTRTKGKVSLKAEDFLKDFLNLEVKVFWPKGWMQTRVLYKESRMAHSRWTSQPPNKLKKPSLMGNAKAVDVIAPMPQLQRAEPGKVPTGSSSIAADASAAAPTSPRTILDDIDDDAEDSESLDSECASSSDELLPKEDDCPDRNTSGASCREEARAVATGNANNSSSSVSNANGFRLAKQAASHAPATSSLDRAQKLPSDMPSRVAATSAASMPTTPASISSGIVGAVCASAVASAQSSVRPLAAGAINSVPARAAIFPALTAAVSKAVTLERQNVGAAMSSIVKAPQSSDPRSQGHLTVTTARPHSVPTVVSILDTSKVAPATAGISAVAKAAVLSDCGPSPGAFPPSSIHSSVGKVMVKFAHGNNQRPASELQRHQHDHPSAGVAATTIAVKRQPQQADQRSLGAAVTTAKPDQRDLGLLPSRGRPPTANHIVTTSLVPGSAPQHPAGGSSTTSSAGLAHFQIKPSGNLPMPSSGSPTFAKQESKPIPQGVTSSHEAMQQRPCALDGQSSSSGGATASTVPSKTQTHWHQASPRPPYIMQQPARQLTPQQQLLQQQRQSQPLQQQQPRPRAVQHRSALTPEQLALKEMHRQQQGHLTVDQIMKLAHTSVHYGSSVSNSASSSASLKQLPDPAKLNSPVHLQAVMSAVGQASSKLHQPWAINANSAQQTGPSVSESFCVPSQPSARAAGRVDNGLAVHGCTTSAPTISRSPVLFQRSSAICSQVLSGSSVVSDHAGSSFSSVDEAYRNSLPKKS